MDLNTSNVINKPDVKEFALFSFIYLNTSNVINKPIALTILESFLANLNTSNVINKLRCKWLWSS